MICFEPQGLDDYLYWQKTDKKTLKRLNNLIKDIERSPFEGVGKPEPLKHLLSGCWSRRLTSEHRVVYMVANDNTIILQCRFHY